VIEIMRFRLAPGRDEAEFIAADRRLQQEFAYQQPGLVRRTTARGADGDWVVIDLWRSAADADACAAGGIGIPWWLRSWPSWTHPW
jgi:hypothetical protein